MLSVQRGQENEAPQVVQRYCPTTKVACHWCRSKTRQSLRASMERAAERVRLLMSVSLLSGRVLLDEAGMLLLHAHEQGPEPLVMQARAQHQRANRVQQLRGGV